MPCCVAPRSLFGLPIVQPLATASVGVGIGVGAGACGLLFRLLRPSAGLWWFVRLPLVLVAALAATLGAVLAGGAAAYLPIFAVLPALLGCGVSQPAAIAAILLLLLAPPILLPPSRTAEVRADLLLLAIPTWHHGYLLTWPAW